MHGIVFEWCACRSGWQISSNLKAKATVTGYADKGTGNAKINQQLAEKRANIVAEQLKNKYGISADRLTVGSKGVAEQPFSTNDWNRVVIMIAE